MPRVRINQEQCKGCELCTDICPKGILYMSDKHNSGGYCYAAVTRDTDCIGCLRCVRVCPDICFEIGDTE